MFVQRWVAGTGFRKHISHALQLIAMSYRYSQLLFTRMDPSGVCVCVCVCVCVWFH
jgi:hypothetical protein